MRTSLLHTLSCLGICSLIPFSPTVAFDVQRNVDEFDPSDVLSEFEPKSSMKTNLTKYVLDAEAQNENQSSNITSTGESDEPVWGAPSKDASPSDSEAYHVMPDIQVCDSITAPGRSFIYCYGKLLQAVNFHHIFPDSKTFVDRPIKVNRTAKVINESFYDMFPGDIAKIDKTELSAFVEDNFDQEAHELQKCMMPDWTETPSGLECISDYAMRKFAHDLNGIWKNLCRRVKSEVKEEPERFSLMYVPHNFVAPGGRFREFYYWDAYWIIKGLLASGMYETSRGMIYNFASIVEQYGFIPNGGRIYYLRRSQPPLFTAMVYDYYEATRNKTVLTDLLPALEKEMFWWKSERMVNVRVDNQNYTMFQYRTSSNVPRPESYREDATLAANFTSKGRKQRLYRDLASAAESGWDFSTRWFADGKSLQSIHTTEVIPVDLNAFVCYNLRLLAYLQGEIGNSNKEHLWQEEHLAFRDAFQNVFYREDMKGWYDYDLSKNAHNTDFYPSTAVPLFTGCYNELTLTQSNDLYDKMSEMGFLGFAGGIPTSMASNADQQWDFPNGWPPLNHMIIEGLRKSNNPRMQRKAFALAQKWVSSNYKVWLEDRAMWEKYDVASNKPRGGRGGEYEVQAGFGWTNGAILDLLTTYGDRIQAEVNKSERYSQHPKIISSHSFSGSFNILVNSLSMLTAFYLLCK